MEPTNFDRANTVLGPAPGVPEAVMGIDSVGVGSVNVYRGPTVGGMPVVISCWRISEPELEELMRTGRIWVTVQGTRMPPIAIHTDNPFED